jgi:hypothetical protein
MAQTFCEKIPLQRQLANLLIQRGQLCLGRLALADRSLSRANSDAVPSSSVFFQA